MKQLKFMLAAATAIGLAAAAQAASTTTSYLVGTEATPENFDADDLQGTNPVESMDGYSFVPTAPATASDNESVVTNQVLNVNTGTDPLFRHLNDKVGTAVDLTTVESLYIDTKVQFTVTPAGDLVKPSKDAEGKIVDKLMIYLAEVTNDTGVVTGTNLMVQAGKVVVDDVSGDITGVKPDAFVVTAEDLTVVPNEWYNLKVNAVNDNGLAVFTIFINNKQVKAGISLGITEDVDGLKFPSMQGPYDEISNPNAISLTYVGFAGEGKIDDLTVATITTVDSVDFTFTFTGANLSSVTYTIGDDTENTYQWSVGETEELDAAGTIKIESIAFSDLYTVATDSEVKVGDTLTVNAAGMEFPITAKALTGDSDAKVPANTKPADIGIESTTGIPATVPSTTLDNMIKWATANKGASTEIATINTIKFDENGNPAVEEGGSVTNLPAQAFLLNCAVDQVETVKDAFKFTALTFTDGKPNLNGVATSWQEGSTFNGVPALDGKKELDDNWSTGEAIPSDAKFFRARLVLPGFNQ